MKKLQISITSAQLTGFNVELADGKPEVHVTIALLSENGKTITTYNIGTESWRGDSSFELPVSLMPLIGDIARELEAIAVRSCQAGQKAFPAPATGKSEIETYIDNNAEEDSAAKPIVTKTNNSAVVLVDDQPINLDDIPF